MNRVTVALGERSYEVVLGSGARFELAGLIRARAPKARVAAIVTSASLRARDWFEIETGIAQHVIEVPDGEHAKDFASLASLCEQLARLALSRDDVVVGVGGGALTDLAGLAAALYLRGIGVVHVATTLVGQVDAAIGGKTAVNLESGKNLVGAFHQPLGVLCDTDVLVTLPGRERRAGLGEVAKCWLLEGRDARSAADASLEEMTELSVRLKARIVEADEMEGGQRALLNYGHTLAHALEAVTLRRDVDELRHGEAVAIGLAFAARLARELGRVDDGVVAAHDALLTALGLPSRLPANVSTPDLLEAMSHDKKAHHDLTFVLAGNAGFKVVGNIDALTVAAVLDQFRGET